MNLQSNVNQFLWTTAMLKKFKAAPDDSNIFSNKAFQNANKAFLKAKEARATKEAQTSLTSDARDFYRQVRLGGEI